MQNAVLIFSERAKIFAMEQPRYDEPLPKNTRRNIDFDGKTVRVIDWRNGKVLGVEHEVRAVHAEL